MRKIENKMITAFQEKRTWTKDNTRVWVASFDFNNKVVNQVYITLFGHKIVQLTNDEELLVLDAGHQTKTTKSRLNAILFSYNLGKLYSKNYQWYLKTDDGDEEWTGSKVFDISS